MPGGEQPQDVRITPAEPMAAVRHSLRLLKMFRSAPG
jgi:hypothetical protein